jgi:DNA-binding response OmpR family regulator
VRLLIVEDETELADALARGLRREAYAVDVARDFASAQASLAVNGYDLVVLDLGLPDGDGLDLCRALRGRDEPPRVLVVTARDAVADRVAGLDAGADDYVIKPFSYTELLARVRALLRRDGGRRGSVLAVGDVEIDDARFVAFRAGRRLDLTAKEFALLRYLMEHAGEVLSSERLLGHVWDENADPFTNTVRVTIGTLRRKLERRGVPQPIETVVGRGYRFTSSEPL